MQRLAAKHRDALLDCDYTMPGHVFHNLWTLVDHLEHDTGGRSTCLDQQIAAIRSWINWVRQDSGHEDEWQRQQRQKYNLLMAAKRGDTP
jgi:hypothetical protein